MKRSRRHPRPRSSYFRFRTRTLQMIQEFKDGGAGAGGPAPPRTDRVRPRSALSQWLLSGYVYIIIIHVRIYIVSIKKQKKIHVYTRCACVYDNNTYIKRARKHMHGNLAEKKRRERKNKIIHHSRRRYWPSHSRCGPSGSLNILKHPLYTHTRTLTHYVCIYITLGGKRFRISADYVIPLLYVCTRRGIYIHTYMVR